MAREKPTNPEGQFGVEKWSKGGGHPKPRPAGGLAEEWQPPTKGTAPADRKKQNAAKEA